MGQDANHRRPRPGRGIIGGALALALLAPAVLAGCRQVACGDVSGIAACQEPKGDFTIEATPARLSRDGGTLTVRRVDGEFDPALDLTVRLSDRAPGGAERIFPVTAAQRQADRRLFSLAIGAMELSGLPAGAAQLTVTIGGKSAYSTVYLYNELTFASAVAVTSGDSTGIGTGADGQIAIPWLHLGPQRVYTLERRALNDSSYRRSIQYVLSGAALKLDGNIPSDINTLYERSAAEGALFTLLGERLVGFNIENTRPVFLTCQQSCERTFNLPTQAVSGLAPLFIASDKGSYFATAEGGVVRLYRLDGGRVVDANAPYTGTPVRHLQPFDPGQSLLAIHSDGSASVLLLAAQEVALKRDAAASQRLTERLAALGLGPLQSLAALAVGDLDGDRRPDLALAQQGAPRQLVLALDQGDGSYATVAPPLSMMMNIGEPISALSIGDLDGDKRMDVAVGSNISGAVAGTIGRVRVYLNTSRF